MNSTDDSRGLRQAVEATQRQLNELASSVAELTAAVKVEDVKRSDLERRVTNLEHMDDDQRKRISSTGDQRIIAMQMLALSAFVSIITSVILLAISHISWK